MEPGRPPPGAGGARHPGPDVAVWHGRVDLYVKGLDLLLEAWKSVCAERVGRELRLILVGSGQDADALRQRIAALPHPNVLWVDEFVHDRERLRRCLSAADVYVLASRHEGFSVAPLEAMACGLPVVASDAPGMSDILEGASRGAWPATIGGQLSAFLFGSPDERLSSPLAGSSVGAPHHGMYE